MNRRLKILAAGSVLLLSTLIIGWYWLLYTESGGRFVWNKLERILPGQLQAEGVHGALSSGLTLNRIRYIGGGSDISVADIQLIVDLDLLPLSVEITSSIVRSVDVQLSDNAQTDNEQSVEPVDILEALRLPVVIDIVKFHLEHLNVSVNERPSKQVISTLDLVARLGEEITVEHLAIDSRFGDVFVQGSIALRAPYAVDATAGIGISDVGIDDLSGLELSAKATGNSDRLSFDIQSVLPVVSVTGVVADVFADSEFDLRIRSQNVGWPVGSDLPDWSAEDLEVVVEGSFDDFDLTAIAGELQSRFGSAEIELTATGSTSGFEFASVRVNGDWVDASATVQLDWSNELAVNFESNVTRLDINRAFEFWPAPNTLHGTVGGSWQGLDVQLSNFDLSVAGTDINVVGSGAIDSREGTVEGALTWRGFQWPLVADKPIFSSEVGDVTVAGSLSNWIVDGTSTMQFEEFPKGDLILQGVGDRDGIEVSVSDSVVLGGRANGIGSYSWRDERQYSGDLSVEGIQSGVLLSAWPGTLSGKISFSGEQLSSTYQIGMDNVRGELRGNAFTGDGRIVVTEDKLVAERLQLNHGAARVELDGSLHSSTGLTYRVNLPQISDYTNDAAGSLAGHGELSLSSGQPSVQLNFSARELVFGNIGVASLEISSVPSVSDHQFINQSIVADGLSLAGVEIESIAATIMGEPEAHELAFDVEAGDSALSIHADGSLANWQQPDLVAWAGTLNTLEFQHLDEIQAYLQAPTALAVSAERLWVDRACLMADDNPALCIEADYIENATASISAELLTLPLGWFNRFIDTNLEFSQTVSGQLRYAGDNVGDSNFNVDIALSAGHIVNTFDDGRTLETGEGVLAFNSTGYSLGSGDFDMSFPGIGDIDVDFEVESVVKGTESPLSGHMRVDLDNVSSIASLFPFLSSEGGRLHSDIDVEGTVAKPIFNGAFSLLDATIEYAPLGTRLDNLQIEASIAGNNRLDLDASFLSGSGSGRITTTANYETGDTTNITLNISGSDLLLVDLPELKVVANPEIEVGMRGKDIQIGGKIVIPEAHIKPTAVPLAQIVESEDVVIVAGEIPDSDLNGDIGRGLAVYGEVQVTLGNDVTIDLDVATTKLGGSVNFLWQEELMPIGAGNFSVNGTVSAIGQVLTISEGAIRFPQVPADNPYLNIAAEREIFGNTQVKTAGVLITGSAKNPVIEAYTYPLTTEERALTLLATGSDFDYEQGVGALDFGTYIAPRLFLSYGIGIFERDNVFSARYDLTKGLGIKASSGQQDSGIDLSYRIDN